MSKTNKKKRINQDVANALEKERRLAMAKNTENLKKRAKESLPGILGLGLCYVVFTIFLLKDAKLHSGTDRGDNDWLLFFWVTVSLVVHLTDRKIQR